MAESEARKIIDELLISAGWSVQDYKNEDFSVSLGVAVREFQLKTGAADYLLFTITLRLLIPISCFPIFIKKQMGNNKNEKDENPGVP